MTKYLASHEWVRLEGDTAVIGITDHAQSELSDVVFVDLPAVGKAIQAGKSFMAVESVKAASDIYAPMSGTVLAVNETLKDRPELVNQKAESDGWMVKIKVANAAEADALLSRDAYLATLH